MSQFDADFDAANDLLAEAYGEQVTLLRGSATSGAVTAQVAKQDYKGESEDGITTTVHANDFFLNVSDYDFGAGAVEPRPGDQIKRTIDGTIHTYEVTRMPDDRCCEWTDSSNTEWTIHTNHIDP